MSEGKAMKGEVREEDAIASDVRQRRGRARRKRLRRARVMSG